MDKSRIYKFPRPLGTHAELKLAHRRDSALNMALALTTSTTELRLIMVRQEDYPIHLMEKCVNNFLLEFKDRFNQIMPGRLMGSARPNWIGPRYKDLVWWAPLPCKTFHTKENEYSLIDAYQVLEDLKNGKTNQFWGQGELAMAEHLIRRKAVVL
jgi:hypothetical protein